MPLPKFARMLAFIKWHASRFDNLGEREPLADPVGWKRGQRSKSEWLSCKFTEDPVPPLFYPSLTLSILAVMRNCAPSAGQTQLCTARKPPGRYA